MEINRRNIIKYGIIAVLLLFLLIYPSQIYQIFLNLLGVIMPLILGAVLAYALNILCAKIEKHLFSKTKMKWLQKSRRGIAILLSLIIVILVMTGVFSLVLPQFISALTSFFKSIPTFFTDLSNAIQKINHDSVLVDQIKSTNIDWTSVQSKVMKYLSSGFSGVFGSTFKIVTGISKGIVNFILAITFAIYILSNKEKLASQIDRVSRAFMKESHLKKTHYVLSTTNKMFTSFIVGQVTEAIILGTLCTLGMLLFRFPYALSVGAFVAITALIPILGAWMGGAVGFLLIAVNSPLEAVLFVVFILVLQQIESNLIYPKVVGTSLGLPGIWVLASITVGGGLGGIVGMLLGVPVAATIYKLLKNETNRRLTNQNK
ncbi:AI-2E family transporter [Companilactobacillus halodurans]|uniref:AI-2E family transporter n=1 Tax=Companilactobacillus halodurans TaxID=2584183 RepID=A0A5P0ZZ94_9LACO|nr:AI-2E family transporter [Companilactobacillus halodurans]MQS75346.1 AI-2E family transporter [Companilactobacillus halodurans]MQS98406.1 AI-2E family transporter [Companilactobacillus halodurans]